MITWACDNGNHGDITRVTSNAFTYTGACNGTVRLITDAAGDPVRPCACTCHVQAQGACLDRAS